MEYVPFRESVDRVVAGRDLLRAVDGQAVLCVEYNAIVVLVGWVRDEVLAPDMPIMRVSVPSTPGDPRTGMLFGWTFGKYTPGVSLPQAQIDARIIAGSALGYALRRLRAGKRIIRSSNPETSVADSWSRTGLVALVGEPAMAIIPPTAVPASATIEIDASAARDALDAVRYAQSITAGVPAAPEVRQRAAWMAREYATSSGRSEALAYIGIASATLVTLYMLGAFKRTAAPSEPSPGIGLSGVPSSPYGSPLASPRWY